jgi:hypothetical protein
MTKLTKVMKPFDDVDLASHILIMAPRHWQDQYELTQVAVPQSMQKLLEGLNCIKKAFLTNKDRNGSHRNMKGVTPPIEDGLVGKRTPKSDLWM